MTDNLKSVVRGWWRSGASALQIAGVLGIDIGDIEIMIKEFEGEAQ